MATSAQDMFNLSPQWLSSLGYEALNPRQVITVLRRVYSALELMVGFQLASELTKNQLDEFEEYIDTNNEHASLEFLTSNVPDYRTVVYTTIRSLEDELREAADNYFSTKRSNAEFSLKTAKDS